jgi:hypothetical protein
MAYVFPTNPTLGDVYVNWRWDGEKWILLSEDTPSTPGVGNVTGPVGAVTDHIATYDGNTGKLIKDGGSTIASLLVPPAAVAPVMDGTAAIGSVNKYAREDHRHPTDTTRAATSHSHVATDVSDFAEAVDDRVGALLKAGSNIGLNYDDTAGTLTVSAINTGPGGGISEAPPDGQTYGRKGSDSSWQPIVLGAVAASAVTFTPAGNIAATDVQAAIAEVDSEKQPTIALGTISQYYRGDKSWQTLDKASVGLSNVDNTSDANKPVSTAQGTADALRVLKAGDTMTGTLTVGAGIRVYNSATDGVIYFGSSGNTRNIQAYAGNMYIQGGPLNTETISATGDLSVSGQIRVGGGSASYGLIRLTSGATYNAYLEYNAGTMTYLGGHLTVWNGNLRAANGTIFGITDITSQSTGGNTNFYLRDTNGTARGALYYDFGSGFCIMWNSTGNTQWYIRQDGVLQASNTQCYKPGGGSWLDSSDARIKDVKGNYESGLAAINALQPVRFTYKGNDTHGAASSYKSTPEGVTAEQREADNPTVPYANSLHYDDAVAQKEYIGLIAQDAEIVVPECVHKKYGNYIDGVPVDDLRILDSTPLIFALVNAVKELSARVVALEAVRR